MARELHIRAHLTRVERWRHGVEIAALIVAAVWGFYVFVYQENLKPAAEPVNMVWKADLTHDVVSGGKELVRGSFTMHNIGHKDAASAEVIVNVYGRHYLTKSARHAKSPWVGVDTVNTTLLDDGSKLLYSYRNLWRPLGGIKSHWVEPGNTDTFVYSFALPKGAYDEATIDVAYCYADRANRRVYRAPAVQRSDGSYWLDFTRIFRRNDGAFDGLTCTARQDAGAFPL